MTIDEPVRRSLLEQLGGTLGTSEATAVVAHIAPEGAGPLACRADIEALRTDLRLEVLGLHHRLDAELAVLHARWSVALHRELDAAAARQAAGLAHQTRTVVLVLVAATLVAASLGLALGGR